MRAPKPLRFLALAALAASLIWSGSVGLRAQASASAPAVLRVLFIGNSYFYYNDSLHNHVQRMVEAGGIVPAGALQYKSSTIGGAALEHHRVDWLTMPGRIGVKEPFELVILQGGSAEPLSTRRAARFRAALAEQQQQIRARGAQVALYMTHAYGTTHRQYRPENIRLTEKMYVEAGNDIGALVIPVGLAFEECSRRYPELELHKPDGTHEIWSTDGSTVTGYNAATKTATRRPHRAAPAGLDDDGLAGHSQVPVGLGPLPTRG